MTDRKARWHRIYYLTLALAWVAGCEQAEPQPTPQADAPEPGRIEANAGKQWKLPKVLREISGLALDSRARLFAHDDERGVIHILNYEDGGIEKSFALGNQPVRDDFEGITWAGDQLVLSNSKGQLYLTREGADGASVEYQKVDTGLASFCEFEGLDFDVENRAFMLPCKQVMDDDSVGLKVVAWSLDNNRRQPNLDIIVTREKLEAETGKKRFPASGIAWNPASGRWILTSAQRSYLLEVDSAGQHLTAIPLPSKFKHVQTEGIVVNTEGQLLLSDEGQQGRARLTVYPGFR